MTKYKIDFQALDDFSGTINSLASFNHCDNITGIKEEYLFKSFSIGFISASGYTISIFTIDNRLLTFNESTINTILTSTIISFDADLTNASSESVILTLLQNDLIQVNQNGNTTLFVYRQNSENDALDKTLIDVNIFDGKFNHAIGLKNIDIDMVGYNFEFNYVYIPLLKRYYYVNSIEIISANITRLHLKEDVLMSWKTLIKNQHMLISRWESSEENFITDDRLPLESRFKTRYENLTDTTTGALNKITFKMNNLLTTDLNIVVTTITYGARIQNTQSLGAGTIDSSADALPAIPPRRTEDKHYYLINYNQLGNFLSACAEDSATASFVISCIWLPFVPEEYVGFVKRTDYSSPHDYHGLGAGGKMLTIQHTFDDSNMPTYEQVSELNNGVCPYLVLADFKFPDVDTFRNYMPYMKMEIFIAYVGWVSVSMADVIDDVTGVRAIIYYAMDFETGKATAYLYDYTRKKVIWSGVCQLGVQIDINTTDIKQNRIARELLVLNSLQMAGKSIGDIASNYATGSYGKMAQGGLNLGLGIGKTILQDMAIMDHMNGTFNGTDNALYSPLKPCLRISYRKRIDQSDWANYTKLYGKPYNKFVDGTTITGYVEIGDIHFNPKNEKIYQDEIDEIIALLKNGVIF